MISSSSYKYNRMDQKKLSFNCTACDMTCDITCVFEK